MLESLAGHVSVAEVQPRLEYAFGDAQTGKAACQSLLERSVLLHGVAA